MGYRTLPLLTVMLIPHLFFFFHLFNFLLFPYGAGWAMRRSHSRWSCTLSPHLQFHMMTLEADATLLYNFLQTPTAWLTILRPDFLMSTSSKLSRRREIQPILISVWYLATISHDRSLGNPLERQEWGVSWWQSWGVKKEWWKLTEMVVHKIRINGSAGLSFITCIYSWMTINYFQEMTEAEESIYRQNDLKRWTFEFCCLLPFHILVCLSFPMI